MHPGSVQLLVALQQEIERRAGGVCESCASPTASYWTPIEGLPTAAQALLLCPACRERISNEVATIADVCELERRLATYRR